MINDVDKLRELYEEISIISIINKDLLIESSVSRIVQHIKNGNSFVLLSAYDRMLPRPENIRNHDQLRNEIRELKFGYIETYGGYSYGKDQFAHEKSFFIPNMDKSTALKLGKKYGQQAVIYKDDNEFSSIYTKDGTKINDLGELVPFKQGDVETKFNKDKPITKDPFVVFNIAYTALVKNNSRSLGKDKEGKKISKPEAIDNKTPINRFAFNLENVKLDYVVETVYPTFTECMGRNNKLKFLKIL